MILEIVEELQEKILLAMIEILLLFCLLFWLWHANTLSMHFLMLLCYSFIFQQAKCEPPAIVYQAWPWGRKIHFSMGLYMHSSDGVEEKAIPNLSMRASGVCMHLQREQIQHSTDCIDCNNFRIAIIDMAQKRLQFNICNGQQQFGKLCNFPFEKKKSCKLELSVT